MNPDQPAPTINPERITFLRRLASKAQTFVDQVYIPDVLAVASFYRDWFGAVRDWGISSGWRYPQGSVRIPPVPRIRGALFNRDLSKVYPVDPVNVAEYVTHSWYQYSDGDQNPSIPTRGETSPNNSFRTETTCFRAFADRPEVLLLKLLRYPGSSNEKQCDAGRAKASSAIQMETPESSVCAAIWLPGFSSNRRINCLPSGEVIV